MIRPQAATAPLDDDLTILWDPDQSGAAKVHVAALDDAPSALHTSIARSPLTGAAAPLLSALIAFRRIPTVSDIEALRHSLVVAMNTFEQDALRAGAYADDVVAARYLLCCAIDEAVSTTAWVGESDWSKNSLLVTFHNETWGGDKAFALIERVRQDPTRYDDLLHLAFYILALGFAGKYRVLSNGLMQLEELRGEIGRQLQAEPAVAARPGFVAEPVHRGRRSGFNVPIWVSLVSCLVLLAGLFLWFETSLINEVNPLVTLLKRANTMISAVGGGAVPPDTATAGQPTGTP